MSILLSLILFQPPPPGTTGELQFPKMSTPYACSAGREGRVYYDLDVDLPYYCDDTNWVTFGTTISGTNPYLARFNSAGNNVENSDLRNSGAPAAGASGDVLDLTKTINAMDGSDTVTMFRIRPTNTTHTGVSNTFDGLFIDSITASSGATESALKISNGWDRAITIDGAGIRVLSANIAAASSGDYLEIVPTTNAMDGSDTVSLISLEPGNSLANHTGTGNLFYGLRIAAMTGDADATETAFRVASGWDYSIETSFFDVLGDKPAAGTSGDLVDITAAQAAMSGGNVVRYIDVSPTGGPDHTGGTLVGLNIQGITPDADAAEYAIRIGGSAGASPWDRDISFTTDGVMGTHANFYQEHNDGNMSFDAFQADPNFLFGGAGTTLTALQGGQEITHKMGADLSLSGTTLTIDPFANVVEVYGDGADTVSIITAPTATSHTERVTFICQDADVTFIDSDAGGAAGTINLAGAATNFVCSADDTLTLAYYVAPVSGNARWVEVSRSVN